MELFEQLRPILGELLAVIITALIALIKKKSDVNKIDKRVKTFLKTQGTPQHKIDDVSALINSKYNDTTKQA